eukprot:g11275.t1
MAAAPIPSDMDNGRTRLEMDTEAPTERSAGLKRVREQRCASAGRGASTGVNKDDRRRGTFGKGKDLQIAQ